MAFLDHLQSNNKNPLIVIVSLHLPEKLQMCHLWFKPTVMQLISKVRTVDNKGRVFGFGAYTICGILKKILKAIVLFNEIRIITVTTMASYARTVYIQLRVLRILWSVLLFASGWYLMNAKFNSIFPTFFNRVH